MQAAVGQTKDVGVQIGVSRTLAHPPEVVWGFLLSPAGLALWLGEGAVLGQEKGARYRTRHGTTGELRSLRELDRVRLTWQPADWDHDTTVQVVIVAAGNGARTSVRFHQEWLADTAERERQRDHWRHVLDDVEAALGETAPA